MKPHSTVPREQRAADALTNQQAAKFICVVHDAAHEKAAFMPDLDLEPACRGAADVM